MPRSAASDLGPHSIFNRINDLITYEVQNNKVVQTYANSDTTDRVMHSHSLTRGRFYLCARGNNCDHVDLKYTS